MSVSVKRSVLEAVSVHVAEKMGLNFSGTRLKDLESALIKAAKDLEFETVEDCIDWVLKAPQSRDKTEVLATYLTVGETYFFREKRHFEVLEQIILPEIVHSAQRKRKCLRLWSAGCATGEEAYSIAITLHRMRYLLKGWDVSILATDINLVALQKAIKGVYSNWSFRNEPTWLKKNYFKVTDDGKYEVIPEIRKMVTFGYLNLAEDLYPSILNGTNTLDVIFCRNVLMYFSPERIHETLERFHTCLVEEGLIIVSACETPNLSLSNFSAVNYPDAIFYRKEKALVADKLILPEKLPTLELRRPLNPEKKMALLMPEVDREVMVSLCRTFANEGRLDEALELSEQILANDKLNANQHYLHAVILLEQDKKKEAIASLHKTLFLDNSSVMAYFMLGNIAMQWGQHKEARKYFQNAVSILAGYTADAEVPNSEGLQAAKLAEMIRSVIDAL